MNHIQNDKITKYYSLRPTDFPVLVRLTIYNNISKIDEPHIVNVEAVLTKKGKSDKQQLFINFIDVTNCTMIQSTSPLEMTQIEIASIKDSQWETANYKVTETENPFITFTLMCKDFTATIK